MADQRSPEARAWRHLYNTRAWKSIRANQLNAKPLCEWCERQGHVRAASIVDHVIPHKGDHALFFDTSNLASLCAPHHDAGKQVIEKRGYSAEPGKNGWPIDPRHPCNNVNKK